MKNFFKKILSAAVLAISLSVGLAGQPAGAANSSAKNPALLIFENGTKQYWYKAENETKAKYLGRDKTNELGVNIKNNKINTKTISRRTISYARPSGADSDKDGLPDAWEDWFGTNKKAKDSDNDKFSDKQELANGYNPLGAGKLEALPKKALSRDLQELSDYFTKKLGNDTLKKFANRAEHDQFLKANQTEKSRSTGLNFLDSASGLNSVAKTSSYSQTNIQVEGVDESDTAKTDGQYIYLIDSDGIKIIDAASPENARVAAMIPEGENRTVEALYLSGGKLVAIGRESLGDIYLSKISSIYSDFYRYKSFSFVSVYNVSNPAQPAIIKDIKFDGSYNTSRLIGGNLYLVIDDYARTPESPLPSYFLNGELIAKEKMPYYFDGDYSSLNLVSLIKVPLAADNNKIESDHYYLPYTGSVFASTENFYLTYTKRVSEAELLWKIEMNEALSRISASAKEMIAKIQSTDAAILSENEKAAKISTIIEKEKLTWNQEQKNAYEKAVKEKADKAYGDVAKQMERTVIHRISLAGGGLHYANSGSAPGQVLNQFAMNEKDGNFYIATTKHRTFNFFAKEGEDSSYSNLYVFNEKFEKIGALENLAPGEVMYSARFIGDRAYLVTFRQIDPLFAIDLTNPSAPKVLGELKILGVSTYLHPYDENTLIGFGENADERGMIKGLKVDLFDVASVAAPKLLSSFTMGLEGSYSNALYNHHDFSYSAANNLLMLPVSLAESESYDVSFNGIITLDLAGKNIKERGRVSFDYAYRNDVKSLYINSYLYSFDSELLKINRLSDLSALKTIELINQADKKTIADIGQLLIALELYFNDKNDYPAQLTAGQPISSGETAYLKETPSFASYSYKTMNGSPSYTLEFDLVSGISGLTAGRHQATPTGIE